MRKYTIVPSIILEEFEMVNDELKKINYADTFRKATNCYDDLTAEDRRWKIREAKRRIEAFYAEFGDRLKHKNRDWDKID